MSYTAILITVLIVYLLFNLIVGLWASNRQAKADGQQEKDLSTIISSEAGPWAVWFSP